MKNKINTFLSIKKSFFTFLLFFTTVNSGFTKENLPLFDPMDVFNLEWATDPRVSPDGKTIVYVRKSNDIMKDRERSNLWQISIDGNDHRPL